MPADIQASRFQSNFVDFLAEYIPQRKQDLFRSVLQKRTRYLTVVLEDVYNTHNASACLRSCECFGIQDVHLVEIRNEYATNKDISVGAPRWLSLHQYRGNTGQNSQDCLRHLKSAGYHIVATTPQQVNREQDDSRRIPVVRPDMVQPSSTSDNLDDGVSTVTTLDNYPLNQKTAILFGNEKEGLTKTAFELADEFLTIPLCGFTESLNLSVSVAVCLFELTRRLHNSKFDWQLSQEEQEELYATWITQMVGDKLPLYERRFHETRQSKVE